MSKELETAIEAAKAAGKILLESYGKQISAERKFTKELVTPLDLQCEKNILSILQRDFPSYSVWSEENGSVEKDSDYCWIVDPLDGTHNFFFGLPIFGVSIALAKKGSIQCGVIWLPVLKELYTAEREKGSFLNGKKISVSKRPIKDAAVNFCERFFESDKRIQAFKQVAEMTLGLRHFGAASFALPALASGRIDAVLEFNEKPGDFAAGWLMIEEAGGKITTFDGKKMSLEKDSYIASSGVFHKKLLEILSDLDE